MRKCAICGKGSVIGGTRKLLRGHYNLTKTSRKYPNLQWVRLPTGWPLSRPAGLPAVGHFGGRRRVKACAACIKALHKLK